MSVWQEHVHQHGAIETLTKGLWQVTGKLPRGNMPRNMVIYQLNGGGLLIHSAIALTDDGMAKLEALGKPELMIVPNGMHRLDASLWKERYPTLRVLAPEASRSAVAAKINVDETCESALPGYGIVCHAPDGIKPSELVYELPLPAAARALVVTDVLMNMAKLPGLDGLLLHLLGSTGFFGITRIGRMMLLKDKVAFRDWLLRMAALPDLRVISVAHGLPITTQCAEKLRSAAGRL